MDKEDVVYICSGILSSVQSLSCAWLFVTPWSAAHEAALSVTNSRSLLKLMSIESVMSSNHLILCHPLLLLPSVFPNITFVDNVMSLLLNTLSRFVIAFLPRSKCLLISWLHSLATVTLEPKQWRSVTSSFFSPSICHEVMGPDKMIFVFFMWSFKPAFFTFLFHLHQEAV